jgi:hypothetical protein
MKSFFICLLLFCNGLTAMNNNGISYVQKLIVNQDPIIPPRIIDKAAVYGYSMDNVVGRFMKEYGVTQEAANIIEIELKTLLIDLAFTNRNLHLRRTKVSQLWRTFILYTRQYHMFCFTYFGKLIHHYPDLYEKTKPHYDSDEEAQTVYELDYGDDEY